MQVNDIPLSFVGRTDSFYVLRNEGITLPRKYARYTNTLAYDHRTELPVYVEANEALSDFKALMPIYAESLTTTPPAYPTERDESDLGLTPARNVWAERFARARAALRHAA